MKIIGAMMVAVLVAGFGSAAYAQTIYRGVQYQYGQYGEIFYGGQNPQLIGHPYLYVPPQLIKSVNPAYTGAASYYGPAYSDYPGTLPTVYGIYPATRFNQIFYTEPQHFVFSDIAPYVDVGQYGFTEDDAHNEAYANVPRYEVGNARVGALKQQSETQAEQAPPPPAAQQTPEQQARAFKDRALPLLSWAKVEHAQGHDKLVEMLVAQAAKYDPTAATAFRNSLKSP